MGIARGLWGAPPILIVLEQMTKKAIESVLKEHTESLMSIPGVLGTGIGLCDGIPCIKVFASGLTEESRNKLPVQLEGHPLKIEESGPFEAYD